jgi:general secretion pathway protein H
LWVWEVENGQGKRSRYRFVLATGLTANRQSLRAKKTGALYSLASRLRPRSRSPGFTLLELLVVLAIATLLLTVTPPLLTAAIPGMELKASARRVAAGLRLAREEAIRTGRDVAFTLDLEARSFKVGGRFRDGRLPTSLDLKLEAAETEMLGEHAGAVRFFPDGSSTGGRVILSRDGAGYQVGVQWLTGRILTATWERK